jgi:hypothetical protein
MKKQEIIDRLETLHDTNEALSESDKQTIKEAISNIEKDKWMESVLLLATVMEVIIKFIPDK